MAKLMLKDPVSYVVYLLGKNKFASACDVSWIVRHCVWKAQLSTETKLGLPMALLENVKHHSRAEFVLGRFDQKHMDKPGSLKVRKGLTK